MNPYSLIGGQMYNFIDKSENECLENYKDDREKYVEFM